MTGSVLENVERFDLINPATGRSLRISVFDPLGATARAGSLPILFVTDADLFFGTAVEMVSLRLGALRPCIVVGVGYGVGVAEIGPLRTRDLTPPLSAQGLAALPWLEKFYGGSRGEAPDLVSFMADVLTPEIVRRHPAADGGDRIVAGASFGGLFALYALFARPDAFSAVVASSPAVYWDCFWLLGQAAVFAEAVRDKPPRIFLSAGGKEQDLLTAAPRGSRLTLDELNAEIEDSRFIDGARELAARLEGLGLPHVEFVLFEGEHHSSVFPAALSRGLGYVLAAKA
jgi:predicted alpha/beta superfamily hydrolase